jgi:hypothetical protein
MSRQKWIVEYMRYHSPGRYEAETLTEAIDVAMSYIEDGYAAPTAILGPDGSVAVDKPALSTMYSRDWGRISTDEIAARLMDEALA